MLTNDGGGVAVPLTRNVSGDLGLGPGVGLGAKCEQEVTRGLIIAASKQITRGALENIIESDVLQCQPISRTLATTVCPYRW